jgi:hypothetical protein
MSAGRGDHGHTAADQVSRQRRQAIVLPFKVVVPGDHVRPSSWLGNGVA